MFPNDILLLVLAIVKVLSSMAWLVGDNIDQVSQISHVSPVYGMQSTEPKRAVHATYLPRAYSSHNHAGIPKCINVFLFGGEIL